MKAYPLISLAALMASPCAAAQAQTAVLAGGCFWGMESVFEHVRGVTSVVSGYAGGSARDANYDAVSAERTGHAESVRITFDPSQVSYAQLLEIFFTVAHDPTEFNRQGPDEGHSYRSAIFPQSPEQERLSRSMMAQLGVTHRHKSPIATRIEQGTFYPAEAYHQGFAKKHPLYPYILINDRPKVEALRHTFPSLYKA